MELLNLLGGITGWACYEQDFRGSGEKYKKVSNFIIPRARGRARADHATWPVSLKRHRMALLGQFEPHALGQNTR
jgi:hypothetical protein